MNSLSILLIISTSLVLSLFGIPVIIRLSRSLKLFDLPDFHKEAADGGSRKIHVNPTPRLGGIPIVISYFIGVLIWSQTGSIWGILVPSFILFVMGLTDDVYPLPPLLKLITQILSASIVTYALQLHLDRIVYSYGNSIELPYWIGFMFSVFIIVGGVNSVNLVDGLDGLASGIVLTGVSLLAYNHYLSTGDLELLAILHFPVIASILGFLRYNTHPASIFMGDGGSNWLGFIVSTMLLIEMKSSRLLHSIWIPESIGPESRILFVSAIMCLSIPVIDTAYVIILRLKQKRNPLIADRNHFHHGLLKLGLSHSQAVFFIYFLSLVAGILGLLPFLFFKFFYWWIPYIAFLAMVLLIPLIGQIEDKTISSLRYLYYRMKNMPALYESLKWFFHNWERANRYTVYLILFATPFVAGIPPIQIGYVAGVMLLVLFFFILMPMTKEDFLDSFLISVGITIVLVSNNVNPIWIELMGTRYNVQFVYNGLFIFLLISSILYILLTFNVSDLIITPTDFLMVMLPLLLLLTPEGIQSEFKLKIIGLRSLILFLALRTIIRREERFLYRIRLVTFAALAYVMMTGVFGFRFVYS